MNVSLNLLARYEALGLTAKETIESVLIGPEEQSAYYEALSYRISHIHCAGAYSSCSMIERIDEEFGAELKAIWAANKVTNQGPFQAPMTPCNARNQARISWFLNARQGGQRNFFPENESRPTRNAKMLQPKIRNIDWHLATTVQQVVSLSLDGTHSSDIRGGIATGTYQPPTPVHCQRTD